MNLASNYIRCWFQDRARLRLVGKNRPLLEKGGDRRCRDTPRLTELNTELIEFLLANKSAKDSLSSLRELNVSVPHGTAYLEGEVVRRTSPPTPS